MILKNLKFIFVTLLALSLFLTGCANQSDTSTDESEPSSENNAIQPDTSNSDSIYPITIQHALGETVIESKPERIAAIAWGNYDVPLALGVVPVGISKANYGVIDDSGLLPWTQSQFKALGIEDPVLFDDTAGLDFEAISDVQPDVILAAYSGITQEEYALLSEIAPVVAYPTNPWQTLWRDQAILNATGMGMKAEGEALVSELEALIAKKVSDHPEINGKTAAFFYFNPSDFGKFYVYLPADPRAAYLTDLGLTFPESIMQLAKDETGFSIELSAENIDLLQNIDIIIAYGNDTLLDALQGDPLMSTMPAVKRGSVALIDTPLDASCTPSVLSIPATIDDYLSIIGEAADKVK